MGFFSNNYNKEGPGVEKNERKKKGFFAFFEIYFRNFWGLFTTGFIYSLISVLGLGVLNAFAKVGMTHVARSIGREKHSFLISDFIETIKKNWKQALALGFINVLLMAILSLDLWYFWGYITNPNLKESAVFEILGMGISLALLIVITYIKYYIWTMTITFNLTIKQMIKNSFQFVFLNFGRNLFISIVMGVVYFGLYALATFGPGPMVVALIILVCVVPGFKTLLIHFLTFPKIKKYMIDPYYAEHKGEDIEKRRALGLDIDEDEIEIKEEDSIFSDARLIKDNSEEE